jgi:hypothetical protein
MPRPRKQIPTPQTQRRRGRRRLLDGLHRKAKRRHNKRPHAALIAFPDPHSYERWHAVTSTGTCDTGSRLLCHGVPEGDLGKRGCRGWLRWHGRGCRERTAARTVVCPASVLAIITPETHIAGSPRLSSSFFFTAGYNRDKPGTVARPGVRSKRPSLRTTARRTSPLFPRTGSNAPSFPANRPNKVRRAPGATGTPS